MFYLGTWLKSKTAAVRSHDGKTDSPQAAAPEEASPPPSPHQPHTLEDMVIFAAGLKNRVAQPGNQIVAFEAHYLGMIEEGFSIIPDADFMTLRSASEARNDDDGRSIVAYVDDLLAARPPAA